YQGQFTVAGLNPAEYRLTAYSPGYDLLESPISLTDSATNLDLQLHRADGAAVRVRDKASRTALAQVVLVQQSGATRGSMLELVDKGVGRIPPALRGRSFGVTWAGYELYSVAKWDGGPIDILLTPAR